MGSGSVRPGFRWREGRPVRGMQGHQFPTEPVLQPARPAMLRPARTQRLRRCSRCPGCLPGWRSSARNMAGAGTTWPATAGSRSPASFLIERSGKEPFKTQPRSGANLGTPEAARVVRALLAPENAGQRWTQREMVAHFADLVPRVPAPSLALVNKVVQHLRDQAFLEQLPNRGFRVRDFEGLLQAWRAAYRIRPSQPSPVLHATARARSPGQAPRA